MRIFLRLVIFFLAVGIIVYGLNTPTLKNLEKQIGSQIGTEVAKQNIYIDNSKSNYLPDWTVDDVLTKINTAREKNGFSKLTINTKLNQAALSRLAVIITEQDYDGKITGLTREKAVTNAGYDATLIGDLVVTDYFKTNDPVTEWLANPVTKGTLLHPDFKDIGIAVKNDQDKVSVYAIFVSPRKYIPAPKKIVWGGPDLWAAVNKRRVELGVNPLSQREELCTIASIRLNQLLELGKLDGHAGFVPLLGRADLKWISEKYNISEFLAEGYAGPTETVAAWENTMGHKALLSGGEYVWGCVYAQDSFAVAIAAY